MVDKKDISENKEDYLIEFTAKMFAQNCLIRYINDTNIWSTNLHTVLNRTAHIKASDIT